jgi:hypothetical protein
MEGLLDSNSIKLGSAKKRYFEALLQVLTVQPPPSSSSLSLNDWIGVLELSQFWLMKSVYNTARSNIVNHHELRGFALKIKVARGYNLQELFVDACSELIMRDSPPVSYQEAVVFGVEAMFVLTSLREERLVEERTCQGMPHLRSRYLDHICSQPLRRTEKGEIDSAVKSYFAEEIRGMEEAYLHLFPEEPITSLEDQGIPDSRRSSRQFSRSCHMSGTSCFSSPVPISPIEGFTERIVYERQLTGRVSWW